MCDITDKEFKKIYLPFYNNVNYYLNNYVIPDLVAFYLANGYSRLIPKIKEILRIKYNLVVKNTIPLILKRYY